MMYAAMGRKGRVRLVIGKGPLFIYDMIKERDPDDWVSTQTIVGQLDDWSFGKVTRIAWSLSSDRQRSTLDAGARSAGK